MSVQARQTIITGAIRQFGVADYDEYWVGRQKIGNTHETRLHRYLVDLIGEIVPVGGRVLDLGVGPGHVFRALSERFETYGVEISSEAIGLYDFDTSRIAQVNLNDGIPDFGVKFDAIIASMIIHHLDDPPKFLQQVQERLAPGGTFVPVIPNLCYGKFRIKYLMGQFPPISLAHKNFQTATEFERIVAKAEYQPSRRLTPKTTLQAKLWPTWFSQDLVYTFRPTEQSGTASTDSIAATQPARRVA